MRKHTRAYRHILAWTAAIGGVLAVSWTVIQVGRAGDATPTYTVARVARADLVRSINTVGQLSPRVSVEVSSQISGLVTEVAVDFNSKVRRDQVLARIDPSSYYQRLMQARADLEARRAAHTLAQVRSRRVKQLFDEDLVPRQDYDDARSSLEQARANLLTGEAAVENARVDLERCVLRAPIDGVVIYRQIEVGKTVVSSLSAPTLFTIAEDLSQMRLVAPISEVDVVSVRPGQPVRFKIDAFGDREFTGRLIQVRNPYTPSDRQFMQPQVASIPTFDAVIDVDNSDLLLRPSLTANVAIVVDQRSGVLQIPSGALRIAITGGPRLTVGAAPGDRAQALVYRLPRGDRNGAPESVSIHVGLSDGTSTEVTDGLAEGDSVVTSVGPPRQSGRRGLFF